MNTYNLTIDCACDYIIQSLSSGGENVVLIKLQKLLYYSQAWHLAFYKTPLFDGKFQAWVHGPVNRFIYDRFCSTKILYSPLSIRDLRSGWESMILPDHELQHINGILEVYGGLTGSQLENMTHSEDPWIQARTGLEPNQRCERDINEALMQSYYAARL